MAISGIGNVIGKLNGIADRLGNGGHVDVGFLEGSMHQPKNGGQPVPMALVAAANEFGNPAQNRPPRPFMRDTFAAGEKEWVAGLSAALARYNYSSDQALELLGTKASSDVVASIVRFDDPPLAQSTIEAKGFSKPLIDTGQMQRAVSYEVHK